MSNVLLDVRNLRLYFRTKAGSVQAVDDELPAQRSHLGCGR